MLEGIIIGVVGTLAALFIGSEIADRQQAKGE